MKEKSEHDEKATPAPGAVARAALRAIDACIAWLTTLRRRFDTGGDEGHGREPAGRHDKTTKDEAAVPEAPRRGFFLRGLLVGLVCLLIGGGAAAFSVYRVFAKQLAEHADVVEHMQEEIDVAKKEETRSVNLMARFQRENAEMRLQLREAEREVQDQKARTDELDKALAEARRPERPPAPSSRGVPSARTAKPRAPQKTGDCAVGGANPGDKLGECIEKFNQP